MIYLVSKNRSLFEFEKYKIAPFEEAMKILNPLKIVQLDSETTGLDSHTKALLTLQLGCTDNQVVFDWATLTVEERRRLKDYLESDRLFLGHNIGFDLTFLYKQDIWPKHIWDTMIAEQVKYLGYPRVLTAELINELGIEFPMYEYVTEKNGHPVEKPYYELSYSLKATAKRRLGIDIDKTVRGEIITEGLTERVVVYAAGDVMHLEDIYKKQLEELAKEDLVKAAEFESECVKSVAYTKYCGIHMDVNKWKSKMDMDSKNLLEATKDLNNYVISLYNKDSSKYNKFVEYSQPDLFGFEEPGYKCKINWSSSQQVIPLFELLGIKVKTFDKKTRKEKKSIEKEQLKPQAADFEIIPLFLRYQKASKVTSTYGQNWLDAVNKNTGRIHVDVHTIGTDTARMSSGGGVYKLNMQNLPNDEVTRGCFTAEKGNVWLSIDYQSQESRLIASVSKDKAMIDLFENGCGDVHSLVAYMSYTDLIPRDTKIEDINRLYHSARQDAKGIEFSINYGGDAHTIANNKGIPIKEAEKIYNDFMKGFPGVATYQKYCREIVLDKGYILMNTIFKHRAHIFDAEWQKHMLELSNDREYMTYFWQMKKEDPHCDTVKNMTKFNRRKSESGKQSINYRIQNRGACCLKLALIKFFNWIIANKYQNIVKICVLAHDEINAECPETIKDLVADTLMKCMVDGGKPFCPNVFLGADIEISDHWVH